MGFAGAGLKFLRAASRKESKESSTGNKYGKRWKAVDVVLLTGLTFYFHTRQIARKPA
jgi:hypothetical protein